MGMGQRAEEKILQNLMPQCVGSFPGYFHTFVRLAFSGENAIPYTKKEGFYLSLQTALSVMLAG